MMKKRTVRLDDLQRVHLMRFAYTSLQKARDEHDFAEAAALEDLIKSLAGEDDVD
jgi:hypothetical protein